MNKATLNLLIDVLSAALFLIMVATGYVLWFALPPGTNRTHELWGFLRHEWGSLHGATSIGFISLVFVHVALHWRWLATNVCKRVGAYAIFQRHPAAASLALLAVLLVLPILFAALAMLSVRRLATPLHPETPAQRSPGNSPTSAPMTGPGLPTLRSAAANVLAVRCAACHGSDRTEGGVRADATEALLAEQRGVRWVIPGDVENSPLLGVVGADTQHPPRVRAHLITTEDVEALRRWIAAEPAAPRDP